MDEDWGYPHFRKPPYGSLTWKFHIVKLFPGLCLRPANGEPFPPRATSKRDQRSALRERIGQWHGNKNAGSVDLIWNGEPTLL